MDFKVGDKVRFKQEIIDQAKDYSGYWDGGTINDKHIHWALVTVKSGITDGIVESINDSGNVMIDQGDYIVGPDHLEKVNTVEETSEEATKEATPVFAMTQEDWDELSEIYQWVSVDANGFVWAYENKPKFGALLWDCGDNSECEHMHHLDLSKGVGSIAAKELLFERPKSDMTDVVQRYAKQIQKEISDTDDMIDNLIVDINDLEEKKKKLEDERKEMYDLLDKIK